MPSANVVHHRHEPGRPAMRARVANHVGRYAQVRRRACNLRQADLAHHLGVSRQWVIAMEQGRAGLDLDLVLRAYEALGLVLRMESLRDAMPDWADALQKEREQTIRRPSCRPRIRRSREHLDELREWADRHERPRRAGCDQNERVGDSLDGDRQPAGDNCA